MELSEAAFSKVTELSERGNELLDEGKWREAVEVWTKALDLVPEPKTDWEAATWLYTSIGDAYFEGAEYADAAHALYEALNCPDGQTNAFIHYTLGQSLLKLDDEEKGVASLLQAYMLDGTNLFDDDEEGKEGLRLLAERNLL
jgi:tetratricopeptide (TPR) repeat protein